jgi:hypothetical protein
VLGSQGSAITNVPLAVIVSNEPLVLKVIAQRDVFMPVFAWYDGFVCLALLLHVSADVLHALFPAALAVEFLVAEQACRVCGIVSEGDIASLLVGLYRFVGDLRLALVVDDCADGKRMAPMHATQVLREEVLAIEVVVDWVLRVGWRAHIAAPEAKFDVLRAHVPFPLILGGKGRQASVLSKRAREGSD